MKFREGKIILLDLEISAFGDDSSVFLTPFYSELEDHVGDPRLDIPDCKTSSADQKMFARRLLTCSEREVKMAQKYDFLTLLGKLTNKWFVLLIA